MAAILHAERGPKYVNQTKPVRRLISEHRISHPNDSELFLMRSSICLPNIGYVIIDKSNKHIKLLDFNFKCSDILELSTCPFDVCASNKNSNEFYVTEPEKETIHCVELHNIGLKEDKFRMKMVKSLLIEEECRGITCWKNGLAVTVMRAGFIGTLGIMDYSGKLKKKCWETDIHTELFKAPWYIDSIKDGTEIVVSDQGNHSIICLDTTTLTIMFIFKSEDMVGPRSLTIDVMNNIYVIGSGESCHNVIKLSPNGTFKGIWLSRRDKLNYPSGISYNSHTGTIILQANREKSTICEYSL